MRPRCRAIATCTLALGLCGALSACGGKAPTTTPVAASNAAPAQPTSASTDGIEDSIANYLAGLAKDKAKNFIIEQLGLKQPSELEQVSSQIRALSAQLQAVEARLSAQIAEFQFEHRIDDLTNFTTDVDHMYDDYFLPLVAAGINVKVEESKTPRDQTAIDKAIAHYKTLKTRFQNFADSRAITTITDKIHNRLQPPTGTPGVLRQYGTVIMTKHRYLSFSDSQKVANLYSFLEEHQALAAWMSIESAISVDGYKPAEKEVDRFLNNFSTRQKEQRDPNAANGLLPSIPPGVVIDRGPDMDAKLYKTKGRPMFTYMGGMYAYAPWGEGAWKQPVPPTVQGALARANNAKLRGFTGWRAPNETQLKNLFSGVTSFTPASIASHIQSLFGNIAIPRTWLWTSDTGSNHYCYPKPNKKLHCTDINAYVGDSTDSFSSERRPRFSGIYNPPNLDGWYRDAQGGLFPVRDTDQEYLAPETSQVPGRHT